MLNLCFYLLDIIFYSLALFKKIAEMYILTTYMILSCFFLRIPITDLNRIFFLIYQQDFIVCHQNSIYN